MSLPLPLMAVCGSLAVSGSSDFHHSLHDIDRHLHADSADRMDSYAAKADLAGS